MTLQPFEIDVFQFNRRALVEKADSDDQSVHAVPLDNGSFQPAEWASFDADGLPTFDPGFRCERTFRCNELLNRSQVVEKCSSVRDGKPAGHRVRGERDAALVVSRE